VKDLVFTNEPGEKASFFETSVDIPPYLKSTLMKQKADKVHSRFKGNYFYSYS